MATVSRWWRAVARERGDMKDTNTDAQLLHRAAALCLSAGWGMPLPAAERHEQEHWQWIRAVAAALERGEALTPAQAGALRPRPARRVAPAPGTPSVPASPTRRPEIAPVAATQVGWANIIRGDQ